MKQTPLLREARPGEALPYEQASPQRGESQARRNEPGAVLRGLRALLRRYTAGNERLRLHETLSLGGRRSVALIECDGKRFLAGLSASGVETIVPVDEIAAGAGDFQ